MILKCPYEKLVCPKRATKIFLDFCPEIFCSFLGASWNLFWASCRLPYLWYYLLSPKEAQKASRKPPESYKKFQGRNTEIFSLLFWDKQIFHKDIMKLTDLYTYKHSYCNVYLERVSSHCVGRPYLWVGTLLQAATFSWDHLIPIRSIHIKLFLKSDNVFHKKTAFM